MEANKRGSRERGAFAESVFISSGCERRCTVLAEVARHRSPVGLFELADSLAGVQGSDRAVTATLHHIDLPKLDNAGMLLYDSRRRLVRFDADPAAIEAAVASLETALGALDALQ